jgi:putative sugar O-methyltransferase
MLFDDLKKDSKKIKDAHQPSSWWARKISRLEDDIIKNGLDNFRGLNTGLNTSFSDSEVIDVRSIISKKKLFFYDLFNKYFIKEINNQNLNLTKTYFNNYLELLKKNYLESERCKYLVDKYDLKQTTDFGCVKKISINGQDISISAIEMINKIDIINQHIDLTKVKTYCEIGGGFGLNFQLLINNFPNIKKFLYLDIYPVIYYGTEYLRKFFSRSIIDYSITKNLKEIAFSKNDHLEIICIPNWEIDKVKIQIDHFHNSHSFAEMSDEIIQKYLDFLMDKKTKSYSLVFYSDKGNEKLRPISFEKIMQKLKVNNDLNLTNVVQIDDQSHDKLLVSN